MAPPRTGPVAGLLLTGGASRRMGIPKAQLVAEGSGPILAAKIGRLLAEVAEPCLEIGPGHSGLRAVTEDPAGGGPLVALAAGARALRTSLAAAAPGGVTVLVVATDLPRLDGATLRWLAGLPAAGSVVPVVGGRPQPLCARWTLDDLVLAGRLAAAGATTLRELLEVAEVRLVDPDAAGGPGADPFVDVDTPEDADRFALAPRPGAHPGPVTAVRAVGVRPGRHLDLPERVVTEEPLEVRAGGPGQEPEAVAVTMRTPGHDFELAAGFLVTEGLITPPEIAAVSYCADADTEFNVVSVALTRRWAPEHPRRQFLATSSCGICGKASIDQVAVACPTVPPGPAVAASLLVTLPDRMREHQALFDQTGGLHAAGLFSPDGALLVLSEDVGRHNAVDKVVGATVLGGRLAPPGAVLVVSGRVSFEIAQKAAVAGVGVVAAVSAPSSLAVRAAERLGVTVAGFVRRGACNLYSHPERIVLDA